MSRLEGKVAVVGRGNSGIELALARRFVKETIKQSKYGSKRMLI